MSTPKTKSPPSNLQLVSDKEVAISLERLIDSVVGEVTAHRSALQPQQVIAELERVKEERARDQMNFETEKCEWESKIDKYKEQCTELQSENKRLQKYVQDLESANINVEEKSQINLCHSDLTSQIATIMNNTYAQTPRMGPPLSIPRDYPMLTSNPLFPSGAGFAPNMSVAPYPSTAFTSGKRFNSSSSSSSYLLAPNNSYPVFSSPYPASSNTLYPTSSNSPHPAPTSAYPCSSNRHYPTTNSSYSAPSSMNQPLGASPYLLLGSRGYDSKFGPSVNQSSDDAVGINSLPDEIIEEIFGYLTQNQLGQIARVCRRWNGLIKSPVLWRKVNVKIFSSIREKNAEERRNVAKSFINGLPSCVTFIRLDFSECRGSIEVDFGELCLKLHQNCPHLEELILARCDISNLLPVVINFCTQFLQCVKKLVFHYCRFSRYFRTVDFNDNSKIEVLHLYRCDFPYFSKTQLSKLLYLKELCLAFTDVNDTWFEDDASFLNQLHVLNLGWTRVTASTFLAIQNHCQNLKELYLCKCDLGIIDHNVNFNNSIFPNLKTICLSHYEVVNNTDSRVTCEGVVALIQSCPSLENVYVNERVAKSCTAHPFVVANRCKSGIVKAIGWYHNHNVDYSHI